MSTQLPVVSTLLKNDIEKCDTNINQINTVQPVIYAEEVNEIYPVFNDEFNNEYTNEFTNENRINIEVNNQNKFEPSQECSISENLCNVICVLIIILPFTICDLYFAFNNITCQHEKGNNIKINITQWFLTCFFLELLVITISFYYLYIFCKKPKNRLRYIVKYIRLILLISIFIWHIIGAILFWNEIIPHNNCGKNLKKYMELRMLFKFIFIFFSIHNREFIKFEYKCC